ncbi:hypothetical protein [Kiloniella sp.]|uniref:hypothetical protein n=1 Tax=Kiloniella sp. TaxID=1938587 RepID=UPI003A8CF593
MSFVPKEQRKTQRGYALLMVLLGLVLLALVAARFGTLASTDVKLVRNLGERAQLDSLMESAVLRVIDGLLQDRAVGFWRADGSEYRWQEQGAEITVIISDAHSLYKSGETVEEEVASDQSVNNKLPESPDKFMENASGISVERVRVGNGLKLSERAIAKIELKLTSLVNQSNLRQKLKIRLTGPKERPFHEISF